jgi:hypothetical protein
MRIPTEQRVFEGPQKQNAPAQNRVVATKRAMSTTGEKFPNPVPEKQADRTNGNAKTFPATG